MVRSPDAGLGPMGTAGSGPWASPGQYAGGRSQGLAEPAEDERGGAGTAEPSAAPDAPTAPTPPPNGATSPPDEPPGWATPADPIIPATSAPAVTSPAGSTAPTP